MSENPKEIVLNEVNFTLPVKRFLIEFSERKQKEMSVTREFVLRFIFLSEACTPADITEFFGFTFKEAKYVLKSLEESSYIKWVNDSVSLTDYAKNNFIAKEDKDMPRFFEVSDDTRNIGFELSGYNILTIPKSEQNNKLSIDLKVSNENYIDMAEKARKAFSQQYYEFTNNIIKLGGDRELYKINHVEPKTDSLFTFKTEVSLDEPSYRNVFLTFDDERVYDLDTEGRISGIINDSWEKPKPLNIHRLNTGLQIFIKETKNTLLANYLRDGVFSVTQLMKDFATSNIKQDVDTQLIIGNLYTKENRIKIKALLEYAGKTSLSRPKRMFWTVDPEGKQWGHTSSIMDLVKTFVNYIDGDLNNLNLLLNTGANNQELFYQYKDSYRSAFYTIESTRNSFINEATEFVVIPGLFAAGIFHLDGVNDSRMPVPIGMITVNPEQVEMITEKFNEWLDKPNTLN
ncbi:hypothetical protein [Thiomicrorhabdus sp.]|uniref:hypothetical protein n=1 Tax=Thiomicrorhabdus sp. TaxID=2039724 RepID=UPI0029C8AFD7|nr:hypothetical protein [Thiomicrorhabdus sp.]